MRLLAVFLMSVFVASVAAAGSTPGCGGGGGDRSRTLRCPEGQYIVGLARRSGMFVDSVSVRCSGERGWKTAGGTGGTDHADAVCGAGAGIGGIAVRAGAYIDEIKYAECLHPGWTAADIHPYRRDRVYPGQEKSFQTTRHEPNCFMRCPRGELLTELTVRYGGWVDSLKGKCR